MGGGWEGRKEEGGEWKLGEREEVGVGGGSGSGVRGEGNKTRKWEMGKGGRGCSVVAAIAAFPLPFPTIGR